MALAPVCTPPQHPCPCVPKDTSTSRAPGFGLAVTPPHRLWVPKTPWTDQEATSEELRPRVGGLAWDWVGVLLYPDSCVLLSPTPSSEPPCLPCRWSWSGARPCTSKPSP